MAEGNKSLCETCTSAIWCPTWSEMKCAELKKRIYNHTEMTECEFYKKRDKNFKESRCQCEDCLKNDLLAEEYREEE